MSIIPAIDPAEAVQRRSDGSGRVNRHQMKREELMNVVFIVIDSLRQDHIGCYGNSWIRTPRLDALAKESAVFERCHPESLPPPYRPAGP